MPEAPHVRRKSGITGRFFLWLCLAVGNEDSWVFPLLGGPLRPPLFRNRVLVRNPLVERGGGA